MRRTAESDPTGSPVPPWWQRAVFYQVYVRSFADSNGDGVGDLEGIRSRLGYLELLGVDALWLTPFFRSPMVDHGYDVADAREVDPLFGDLEAFDRLVAEAHDHGIKVTIDVVPNHTSDRHPWFQEAVAAPPGSRERNRYVFRDGRGALPPNNWISVFGGPAWTRVPDGQWYLHLFTPQQPDLNFDESEVRADLVRTLRFWLDRGVDGFRVDVADAMGKPAGLPDMPEHLLSADRSATHGPLDPRFDNEATHEVHRLIRKVADEYPGTMAVGEVWVETDEQFAGYVRPDELHLAFNFALTHTDFDADAVRRAIDHSLAAVARSGAPATWTLSNHDVTRHVTRYGGGARGIRRARAMALVQLALPGVVYLYNGEELGLPDVELPDWALRDPLWERSGHVDRGRDGARIPLPWEGSEPPFGFSTGAPWLPVPPEWAALTVEAQLEDPDSMLSLYRAALELRKTHAGFGGTELEWYGAPPGCFAYRRKGGGLICALNTSDAPVPLPPGEILLSSGPMAGDELPPETAVWLV
ncbi:glycoside hydrolase family 13 protein [Actinokineospora auranticolor]|uniref:Alpha-glucosidase n=1 Tax=Actinokineospora auranticolor TaxID=155976 RepID=A0A2S6GV53_9PSEU|nr:glycoside hydrolase family 13 protein [Actinokineospora auranticolor]PPK69011.1 alpha-glucosidase [Actinokineospora auranticolor]